MDEGSVRVQGKLRRLRRTRRLSQLGYWTAWVIGGLVFVLLVASGIAGSAAG